MVDGSRARVAALVHRGGFMRLKLTGLAFGAAIGFVFAWAQLSDSVLFGAGWSVAGTCPGPVAVMIGQGRFVGLAVLVGLLGGVLLQGAVFRALDSRRAKRANTTELGAVSEAV